MKAKKKFKDTIIGKLVGSVIGIDQPVKAIEAIGIITGNFKKSPVTTITGAVLLLGGVILLVTKPEHEVIAYSLMTAGASLLGIKDFWKPKKQNRNVRRN